MALTRRYQPHVALVDLFVGQESGAEICERLRAESPPPNVLLISGAGRINPNAARAAGAAGFISKDWPAADIAGAVRMVGLGMTVFRPQRGAGRPAADRARARGARPDRAPARRTARSPSSSSSRRTRSRSTRRRSTASSRCATAPRRCRRRSGSGSSRERAEQLALRVRFAELASSASGSRRWDGRPTSTSATARTSPTRTVDGMERAAHAVLDARLRGRRAAVRRGALLRPGGAVPGELAAGARAGPRRRLRQLQVGLRLHGRLADRRRGRTRSRSSRRAQLRRQWARDAGAARRRGCGSTRSTPRRSRAACSTTPRCGRASTRSGPPASRIGLSVTGTGQAATIDRALEVGGFDEVQATWNLHERSAEGALARAPRTRASRSTSRRRWPTAASPTRGAPPALRAAARRARRRRPTRSRWRPRWPSRGRRSCSAAPRRSPSSSPTWRRATWRGTGGLERAGGAGRGPYWATRSALPWN